MAIRVGRWDCKTCGHVGNLGPTTKCEKCGAGRPANVKFYLSSDAEIVTDKEKIKEARAGADWVCSYCTTQNKSLEKKCKTCGSPNFEKENNKKLEQKIYTTANVPRDSKPKEKVKQPTKLVKPAKPKKELSKKEKIGCILIPIIVLVLTLIIIGLSFISKEIDVEVVEKTWHRTINLEEYKLVTESDWSIPAEGTYVSSQEAIHHYDKVYDGTETRTRDVKVKVGEEEYVCGQKDLGNGYFEDEYCYRDIYETQSESYEVDVYKDVPVYETEYTYTIWRWTEISPITSEGNQDTLYWAKVPIDDKIRSTDSSGTYIIFILDHKEKKREEKVEFEFWNSVKINDMIKAKKSKLFNFYIGLVEKE